MRRMRFSSSLSNFRGEQEKYPCLKNEMFANAELSLNSSKANYVSHWDFFQCNNSSDSVRDL